MREREVTFRFAAEQFLREYTVLTHGQRSPIYVGAHRRRLDNHIFPFLQTNTFRKSPPACCRTTGCTATKRQ